LKITLRSSKKKKRGLMGMITGCASPAGLSYCFFSIDALGSSSTIRFESIKQKTIAGQ